MNNIEIEALIVSYLSGNCTEKEEVMIQNWINSSAENLDHFEKSKYAWISSFQIKNNLKFSADSALNQLNNAISNKSKVIGHSENESKRTYTFSYLKAFLKYAALFLLLFGSGIITTLLYLKNIKKSEIVSQVSYEIPIGSKGKTTLPDGTKVWLNAGSKLSYAGDYNTESRIVQLEGEGFFEVKTNPEKPFIVKAKNIDIKAYGTVFNVRAYQEDREVITTLVNGKVFIEGKDNKDKSFSLKMKPGQCIKFITENKQIYSSDITEPKSGISNTPTTSPNKQILKIDSVKTELFTSWKDDRWIIENESLLDLLKKLERRYDVKFQINPEELKNYHFSGTIQNESIDQFLSILSFALPLKYDINRNIIKLHVDLDLQKKFMKML